MPSASKTGPTEAIDDLSNYDRGHKLYGILHWRDMFSRRQLLCNGTGAEVFSEILNSDKGRKGGVRTVEDFGDRRETPPSILEGPVITRSPCWIP
jgi:hypothetical protein